MADETPWTPVGKEPVDDQGWIPVAPPESGYIAGGLRSIYRGLAEIPRAAGDALEYNPEYLASGDSTATRDASKLSFLNQAGKVLSDVSESAKEVVAPAVYGTNEIKRSVFQGVESAPLSLAYKIPGYVGAVAAGTLGGVTGPGSLLTATAGAAVAQAPAAVVMYRATAQQNMEDLDKAQSEGMLKPGTTNAQKLATAQAMAHQEWIGESVSDVAENVMFSKLPFLGAAVKSAKGVLTPGLKSFAKTYAGVWVAEQTGEGYTAATQAALKNEILPADQQQTPWEAAKQQAGPTTVMTLLFTSAGHAGSSFKGHGVTKYLEDEHTSPDVRFQLASMVASRLKESNGPEVAQNFMDHAADAIANPSSPYSLDLNDPALLTPYKPVDETPATPLEQSGQDALDALKARVNPDNDIDTTDAAVAHVTEVKAAQTEAELNLQTATETLAKKMATPPPEPVTPETATPETFNPLKVSTTPAEALDYQRATGDTAYEVVRKDGKFVFEKTLETLKAEGYATTPSGNPFQSKAAAEKRIDLEQYEAVPFKKGWIGKPKTFLHQADVHAEELAKTLVEGGIAADDPMYAKIINERRTRERVPDPQTGLIAREHHNPTLERAVKEGRDFGYADVDLTNLGGLNEWAGGVEQANPYMKDIAQILVNTVQSAYPTAQVFRKGGDEFGVIAPGTNSKKLDVVLAKAQEAVKAYTISNGLSEIPHTKKGNPSGVGITYGTADTKGKSSTDVLKIADARTAKSKQALKEAYNVDAKLVGAIESESLEGQTQRVVKGVGQDNSGQREAATQVKRPEPVTPEPLSKPEAEAAFSKEYTARLLKGDFRGAFEKHSDDMIEEYADDPANQAVFNMDAEDLAEHLTTLADGIKERASKNVKFAVKGDENVSADKRGLSDGVLRGDAGVGDQGTRSVATQGVEKGSPDTVEGRTLVEASIKRSIAAHVGTTPEAVQLSLVPNVGDYKVANSIARLFGKYVYTADTAGDASLGDAFVSGNHPDAIFISKNTDKPVLTLLGHELLHNLAAENSELYNKFKLYIEANNKSGVAEKYKAGLKKISQYSTLDDAGITEEYLGNVVGHMFAQQSFWEKLARTEPTLFARILNILRDMLQTIKSNFQGAASTLKDVNEAETVTAKVFAKYARLYSEGKFSVDITNPDIRFSASEEARPWYSKLENLFTERLKSVKQEKTLPRSHFESILKDKNLKADEIKASGIEEFLKTKERFTAKEVQDELKANAVQLHDVVLGEPSFEPWSVYDSQDRFVKSVDSKDKAQALANEIGGNIAAPNGTVEPPPTHFSQYQEPGSVGGSYREMFVTAPSNKTDFKYKENGEPVFDSQGNAVREPVNTWQDGHSQYSDIQNPIVRIRFNTREVDGKRILFVEEMQGPSDANQKKMPDYLYKRIYDLGVKRVLSYAKENGFDGVAWTPGEMQAKRYDLSKQVDNILVWGDGAGKYFYEAKKDGVILNADKGTAITSAVLSDTIGKGLADKAVSDIEAGKRAEYSGVDLAVGGEGLKDTYDKRIPGLMKKYGKEAVGELAAGKKGGWEVYDKRDGTAQYSYDQENAKFLADRQLASLADPSNYGVRESEHISGLGTVPYIPITAATPSSQMKFSASLNDPVKAAKGLNDFFKKIPYSQIATDAANKIYRFVIPVDRQVTLNASQKTYAPIKSLLNQFIRQRKEKAGRIQSDMTDGAHIWKRFEKQFKTDAEVQNFSDMVWNATEYELHADGAASGWNAASWEKAGMLKKTGKTLEEAQKIISDQYRKLTPEQKTVHLEMLHHVQQMYQAGRQAELAWLDPAKVKEAEAWLQDEAANTFNKVEKPELVDLVKDIDEHYPTLRGDYMPMMRFGDLIVRTYETDKNGELGARTRTDFFNSPEDARKFIEAVNSNNTSYQNDLKAAGDDAVAQAAVREKYKDYNLKHAKIETNPEYRKDVVNIPASLVDKISKAAANQGITGDALEELKQSIEGIRANLLPRTSTKSSKLHREGVAGYEKDVIRVYLTYVRNHALANAQLTHGAKIEQTFRDMRNKIDAVASEPDYDVDAVRRMGELADHLYGIEKAGSREKVNEFTKTVGKITFAWYLSSPSTFAVQWSQPFMVTIPKMGARHGFGKAFAAYTKAAKQYLHGEFSDDKIDEFDRKHEYVGQRVTDILDQARDARGDKRVQLDKELKEIYNSFEGAEKRLLILKVLSHQGQIDLAMSHNAADVVAGATADTKALNWIVGKGAFFMQKSETGSRRAAAISAFELQFNGNNFTEANDYATNIISDTLMDFDAQNRGAAWRGNTGRILGQFQFFRMHMVGKLAQLTKDAIGGEYKRAMAEATTQEEKDAALKAMKEARKEFAYVMGSSFALAGAMGTPLAVLMGNTGMSAIWAALALVFGDEDDPWDPKRDFELAVREAVGDTFGNVVLKGLPSLIGADISRRIGLGGMGDIIQGDPPAGLTPTAKANWYAGRILGPSWGVMSDTIRSADALADGDLAGAFRAGSPKIMRDVAKMFSTASEGVEAGGKTILKPEDVSVWSMALMFSGINPMEVALAGEESRYLKNISTELSQRRSMLIKHLAEATVDQDLDAKEAAIEKINKFSETQPMLKITQQELVRKIKKIRDGREGKLSKREMLIQEEFGKK